jgi:type I restriction enzyme S subunit
MSTWKNILFPACLIEHKVCRSNQINTSDIQSSGRYPVVDQGQSFIAGYANDAERVIHEGLPYVVFGDHTRCFKYVDFPFILGADGTKVLKPNPELFDARFFYYAALALDIPSRGYNRHFTLLKEKSIPQPELDEQRQIAAVLWAVQQAIERQERLIALTAELKKAVRHKLFTEGTRGEPLKQTEIGPVPESWPLKQCDELCSTISVGVVVKPRSHYVHAGVPAFRSFNVGEDCLIADDLVYFSHRDNEGSLSKSKLRAGDVLIVRTGYPGTSCVVPKEFDGANCIDILFARPGPLVESPYLSRFLNSAAAKKQTTASSHGLAQQHLNVGAVKRVLVPLAVLDEQREIVTALAAVDRKAETHTHSTKQLTSLFRTLLHQLMTAQIRVHDLNLSALGIEQAAEPAGAV